VADDTIVHFTPSQMALLEQGNRGIEFFVAASEYEDVAHLSREGFADLKHVVVSSKGSGDFYVPVWKITQAGRVAYLRQDGERHDAKSA